jgi:hypothetical protein
MRRFRKKHFLAPYQARPRLKHRTFFDPLIEHAYGGLYQEGTWL